MKETFFWVQIKPEKIEKNDFLEYVKIAVPRLYDEAKEMLEKAKDEDTKNKIKRYVNRSVSFMTFDNYDIFY
jgi:transcription antitermination factor NusA-like protein